MKRPCSNKANSSEHNQYVEYSVIDATDRVALLALGERRFDAACTMTMMDMANLGPMLSALRKILKPVSRFAFLFATC